MKKLLVLLFSLFFLSSPSVFADDISDFQIEGISIGDSLLDYMTKDEIFDSIELHTGGYQWLKDPSKYAHVDLKIDSSTYDFIYFFIKNNSTNQYITDKNEQYTILSVNGYIKYTEDFEGCIQKSDEIVEVISGMFPNALKSEWKDNYNPPDPSGKSILESIEFALSSGATIDLQCLNLEETFRNKMNWMEGISVGIDSAEINSWLRDHK